MSTATLNAPQTAGSASSRRRGSGGESTPGSMTPPSAKAAVSTPKEIDFNALVHEIMKIETKNAVGTTRLVSNKSKQHIFALACKAVRSHRGIEPVEMEVKPGVKAMVPGRISDEDVKSIKEAIGAVWLQELRGFLSFGGAVETCDLKIVKNQPVTKVIMPENSTAKDAAGNAIHDLDVRLKLQAVVTRAPETTQEAILVATMGYEKAKERLASMDKKPGKYDREDYDKQHKVITVHEWKIQQLKDLKALEERRAAAVAALDAEKALGRVNDDEYAAARKAIESAVS